MRGDQTTARIPQHVSGPTRPLESLGMPIVEITAKVESRLLDLERLETLHRFHGFVTHNCQMTDVVPAHTYLTNSAALLGHIGALKEERQEVAGILREIIATDLTSDLTLIAQIRAVLVKWGEGAAGAASHPG